MGLFDYYSNNRFEMTPEEEDYAFNLLYDGHSIDIIARCTGKMDYVLAEYFKSLELRNDRIMDDSCREYDSCVGCPETISCPCFKEKLMADELEDWCVQKHFPLK